ncbi:hypothetical protein [Vibrio cionasavignyae]|uniref:hypothetical protein n=1 Tax=Vibrio cionasavignyae TaxID=2910252 RepID=UPI003D0AF517
MDWFNDILETGGEILGGAVDTVGGFSDEWLGIKLDGELERADSSNPDEQRKHQNDYQERNGDVVQLQPMFNNTVVMGVGAVIVLAILFFALKKGG